MTDASPALVERSPPVVLWFRQDLRLHDHLALFEALRLAHEQGVTVIPFYCVDPRQFADTAGFPKTGAHRARFLLESLHGLRRNCRALGSDLVVRLGLPEHAIPELVHAVGAQTVVYHEEPTFEERETVRRVSGALRSPPARGSGGAERAPDATLIACRGHTMLDAGDLPFELASLPDVFTPYLKRVQGVAVRAPRDAPRALPPIAPLGLDCGVIPSLRDLGLDDPPHDTRAVMRFDGGEDAGLSRLHSWMWDADRLQHYKQTRNGLLARDDSSKLSPWLALGCLSPRVVHAEVRRYERERVRNADTEWLVYELHWRDYFRWLAEQRGVALFRAGGLANLPFAWRTLDQPGVAESFVRWTSGRTGFPLVDAAMRELLATGYTSNRARQNVASFLTRVLGIDWRLGASWFESRLVDYDVSSNWGNWAYVSGVGTDARGFRFFNVHKQARDYDPDGAFPRHWLPELAAVPDGRIYQPELLTSPERLEFGVVLVDGDAPPGAPLDAPLDVVPYPLPMVDLLSAAEANGVRYARAVAELASSSKRGVTPRLSNRNV